MAALPTPRVATGFRCGAPPPAATTASVQCLTSSFASDVRMSSALPPLEFPHVETGALHHHFAPKERMTMLAVCASCPMRGCRTQR
mmetsp:Transcript_45751/g.131976  ORF Transcript_45751/g.131976 Transcript_45751/m.131976 type:complete len:86 (-) Transcript_45751:488-745(-)